jgi:carbonic anhydrase/acetyltransferase-like protein (isoleucine patch superfamily)
LIGHPSTNRDVNIGNDVWIGSGVTIMSGITIGDGAVLSANACVVKNVPPYHIVGGNPAKFIKQRFDDDIIQLLMNLKWWTLPLAIIKDISSKLCQKPDKIYLINLISSTQFP